MTRPDKDVIRKEYKKSTNIPNTNSIYIDFNALEEYSNKQDEYIDYLEKKIDDLNNNIQTIESNMTNLTKEVLAFIDSNNKEKVQELKSLIKQAEELSNKKS